ncbi:MAG: hypothetical protein J4G05_00435 [Chlorobi bacterium]|nr:hypothetical protein [Chlorobiota bacterium]
MSKRRESQQQQMWVQTQDLPEAPGHPFYTQLNTLLASHRFDAFTPGSQDYSRCNQAIDGLGLNLQSLFRRMRIKK